MIKQIETMGWLRAPRRPEGQALGRTILRVLLILALGGVTVSSPRPAMAAYFGFGTCTTNLATTTWWGCQPPFSSDMEKYLLEDIYQNMIVGEWWDTEFKPALQSMSAQLNASVLHQAGIIGTFYDGLLANQTKGAMQTLEAQAYKNYTPGEGLCRFGTLTRSLAASDMKSIGTLSALASIGQARQLGTKNTSADRGQAIDREARIEQFERVYCDPADNNGKLGVICNGTAPQTSPTRYNKDISINRTLLGPQTLRLDYGDATLTSDEEDIVALSSNLYGHDVLDRPTSFSVSDEAGNSPAKLKYMALRHLVAFRNVAQNSFNQAAARRSAGAPGSGIFMENIMRELGLSDTEAKRYISNDQLEPSYHAQMDVLTKKIYQNPNFYTNLMDKPANVDRQVAAMQAVSLMQDRDISQSLTRQELLLSLLLEMKIRREQADVVRLAKPAKGGG